MRKQLLSKNEVGTGNPEQEEDPVSERGEEEEEDSNAISVEVEEEEEGADPVQTTVKDVFDLKNIRAIAKEGEEYFEDFDEKDREEYPELFLSDEELDEIFKKMTESEKKQYLALKDFHLKEYMKAGRITPLSELVQAIMKENKPNIPSSSKEQQEALRDRLLQEARKMSELREHGMAPEIKPPKKV